VPYEADATLVNSIDSTTSRFNDGSLLSLPASMNSPNQFPNYQIPQLLD